MNTTDEAPRGEHEARALTDEWIGGLEQFIDEPPNELSQAEIIPPGPETPDSSLQPLRASLGWPERYLDAPTSPLEGKEWLEAFKLAARFVEEGGIVLLYGKRGTGKTAMAAEIARRRRYGNDQTVGKTRPGGGTRQRACYRKTMRFFMDIQDTYKPQNPRKATEVIDELAETALLVLDEFQVRGESAFEDNKLTHLLDLRYDGQRPTILISNHMTKQALADSLNPSIIDRVAELGVSIPFMWESFRQKGGRR